ncbi:MAG: dTDP-4-dehydrorhamnose reductase [Bacteroidales bacterium]|nr:dTDP-4-dehydrorhamnose reductase [Bacteroidales bacterium]
MNILVTGAGGQLGNELRLAAARHPEAGNFIFSDIADETPESLATLRRLGGSGVDTSTVRLDITDPDAIRTMVRERDIRVIVNCAAYTNVDAAENDPVLAGKLNAEAPAHLAGAMQEADGLLLHISTDYVFGKEPYNTPCREDQEGTPTGVYGQTKLLGEQAVRRSGCRFVILRTAWLYSEFGRNFVRTMLHLTGTRPQLKVVFDQAGTPTYAGDLAEAILTILGNHQGKTGIYHYSNEGVCSWFDFAKTIAQLAGNDACEILPCHSDEFPSPVRRPAYSVLDKTKVKQSFGLKIPYWTDSLRKCLENIL